MCVCVDARRVNIIFKVTHTANVCIVLRKSSAVFTLFLMSSTLMCWECSQLEGFVLDQGVSEDVLRTNGCLCSELKHKGNGRSVK